MVVAWASRLHGLLQARRLHHKARRLHYRTLAPARECRRQTRDVADCPPCWWGYPFASLVGRRAVQPEAGSGWEDSVAESATAGDKSPALDDGVTVRSVTEMIFSEPGTTPNRGVWPERACTLRALRWELACAICALGWELPTNWSVPAPMSFPKSTLLARVPSRSNTRDHIRGHSSRTGDNTWCSRKAQAKQRQSRNLRPCGTWDTPFPR